jgi:hypothetical protein
MNKNSLAQGNFNRRGEGADRHFFVEFPVTVLNGFGITGILQFQPGRRLHEFIVPTDSTINCWHGTRDDHQVPSIRTCLVPEHGKISTKTLAACQYSR